MDKRLDLLLLAWFWIPSIAIMFDDYRQIQVIICDMETMNAF